MAVLCEMTTIQYLARSARLSVWLSKWACPKMTSGQSNWHKAHRRRKQMVQCYSTGDGNVSSHEGTLAPPGEYDWIVHPSAHLSPQPKRLIDRFSHFCTAHGSVVGHAGHVLYPNNCPIAWGIWAPPDTITHWHLDRLSCFWATVCKTVRPMLSDRCPVCASVCLSCLWRWCTGAKRLDGSRWNFARR